MAKKHTVAISPDVHDVLTRSTITDTLLVLPEQLDRKLYEQTDKVIKAAGGKWNRFKKGHVFAADPRPILGLALDAGGILDTKKANQQFFTPESLADKLAALAGIKSGDRVLEPSAGAGALALAARKLGASVFCVEIDQSLVDTLRGLGFNSVRINFLHWPIPDVLEKYDVVLMNPPFENGQDVEHIMHAYKFLKPGGTLVSVAGASVTFRTDGKYRLFKELAATEPASFSITPLPEGSFSESGTDVSTVVIRLRKPV